MCLQYSAKLNQLHIESEHNLYNTGCISQIKTIHIFRRNKKQLITDSSLISLI